MIKIIDTETGFSVDVAVEPHEYHLPPREFIDRFLLPAWINLVRTINGEEKA